MDIDDICIDFKKKDLMMKLIFFKNKYNKIFLIMGNKKIDCIAIHIKN
jgi:hypothetical protein